jgi:hypothetical protein
MILENKESSNTICALCGKSFRCSAGIGNECWCTELPNIMPVKSGARCYCPECLKLILEEKLNEVK